MKKLFLLAVTLAALAACKKDDTGPGKQDSNSGTPVIEVASSNPVELGYEAGTFSVDLSVQGGLELDGLGATIRQEGEWLSYTGAESGSSAGTAVMSFKYLANDTQKAREATVTITYPDADPVTVSVSQDGKPEGGEEPVGERYVAYMKKHYAGTASWARPEVMKFGKTITVEMLVKHDEDFVSNTGDRTQWQGDWVGSMFGIEARFLIRHGDNTDNYQEWEVVYVDAENNPINIKSSIDLPADVWTHIAVVFDGIAKTVTLYQDGKVAASDAMNENTKDIDLTETYTNSWQTDVVQQFCLGRSYDNTRDFCGMMSEVRVWNRALSGDEINADGHFYSVSPDSNGLVAYWKLDDGDGYVIRDYTSNGNNLTGYVLDDSNWDNYQGESHWSPDMQWSMVQFPE